MHTDAFQIDDQIVTTLIDEQCPEHLNLELRRLRSDGSDNVIYRLGTDMCVRLPLTPRASAMLIKEVTCLPKLAGLPLEIPRPVFMGHSTEAYQSRWAIYHWIVGDVVSEHPISDALDAAEKLAGFIGALQDLDASDAPIYGAHNNYRGCPLRNRHAPTIAAIQNLSDLYNTEGLQSVWDNALNQADWFGKPVWIHGDIHAANLLMQDGEMSAVIDFGLMAAGDPAVDLIINWSLFEAPARSHFRSVLGVDEDTWLRGRAWALSIAVIALAYYRNSHPYLSAMSMRVIKEVLNDAEVSL